MNSNVTEIGLVQFGSVYILLLIILWIMKFSRIDKTRLLVLAGFRMSLQLVLAGLVLTYIFKNPHPVFILGYLAAMIVFSIYRVLSNFEIDNKRFRRIIAISIGLSGSAVLLFFIYIVVGVSLFNPQYAIPIGGMLFGNSMTGVQLGLKSFAEQIRGNAARIEALQNAGAHPKEILIPFVNRAMETAMLPTLNSMLGMGIVNLPGMMTGQILSGTLPMTAIIYQIAIIIAIATVVSLTVFLCLYAGYSTLYNDRNQIMVHYK
ncbi:ABC transporter permease [Gallicola sp. Sow4_E12]|uniref:ABC transporter permease n=1 Tax=Gallicola sp. Sow4_E12 TaxID=3438785 RepID=UPI003F908352